MVGLVAFEWRVTQVKKGLEEERELKQQQKDENFIEGQRNVKASR